MYPLGLLGYAGAHRAAHLFTTTAFDLKMMGLFCPAEWLWRSLTYWRRQPIRRDLARQGGGLTWGQAG